MGLLSFVFIYVSLTAVHKENGSGMSFLSLFHTPQMDRTEIKKAASELTDRFSLLVLLNRLKKDDLGDKAHPFTIAQLNYFCHPARNSKHYKTFTIPKKSGKLREISAPTKMLKSLLTYMNVILQAMYEPTGAAMGFVPGRSVVDNARKHVGMNYVLNLDLENFFPSIPQARVWGALQSKAVGFNRDIASAVAGLCCTEMTFYDGKPTLTAGEIPENAKTETRNVLPQGAPTSPILTNIVSRNLDRKLSRLARHYGLNYTRYADDITFSSLHNVYQKGGEFMNALYEAIESENFKVNSAKTRLQVKGMRQEVTGLVVSDRVNVTRDYVRSIASLLFIWKQHGYDSAYARFMVHYHGKVNQKAIPSMERVIQGKLMYMMMVKGTESPVVKRLTSLFDTLVSKRQNKISDINYIASYKLLAFEKQFTTKVNFSIDPQGPIDSGSNECRAEKPCLASCIMKGEEVRLSVSDSCKKMLSDVLGAPDETQKMEILRNRLYVSLCQKRGTPFWMVMKSRPSAVYASTKEKAKAADGHEIKIENDMLADLVSSDFDLNILDKWDTTGTI